MGSTIYELTLQEEHILWMLERSPRSRAEFDEELFDTGPKLLKLKERGLVWQNPTYNLWHLTSAGLKQLRAGGKKRLLPHLNWKSTEGIAEPSGAGAKVKLRKVSEPKPKRERHV